MLTNAIDRPGTWILFLTLFASGYCRAESSDGWIHYGGSERGLQYSSLSQINKGNVRNLEIAWTYRTGELGQDTPGGRGYVFESNPILVENKLFVSTGSGIVIALAPATGTEIWRYDPKIDRSRRHALKQPTGGSVHG